MKDEAIFYILKFSPSDWVNHYDIDDESVDEFILWIWSEVEAAQKEIDELWVDAKVGEYNAN